MPPHAEWHALLVDKARRQVDMIRRNLTVWCGCRGPVPFPLDHTAGADQMPPGTCGAILDQPFWVPCASLSYCALLRRLTMSFGSSLPLCAFPNAVGGPSSHHPGRPSIDVSG